MTISQLLIAGLAFDITAPVSLHTQTRGMKTASEQPSNTRIALVISNGAYQASPLKNPTNDVRAVTQALEKAGVSVYSYTNLNQKEMKRVITEFGGHIPAGGTALFRR